MPVRLAAILPLGVTYVSHDRGMNVIEWLLDSDPAIRWQVMRDLTDAPADEVAAERAKVATGEAEGEPSRWIALKGLRVLRWAEAAGRAPAPSDAVA